MASVAAIKSSDVTKVLVFFGGLLLFVGLRQISSPWKYLSLAGVLLSVSVISLEAKSSKDLASLFGLRKLSGNGYYYLFICLLLGALWGIGYRDYLNIPMLPVKVTLFAVTAMVTGAVEEIIFRGYIQQKLRKMGLLAAITGTSALHTFYKCFIFMVLPPVVTTDYLYFALITFSMGCLLGLLKEYGRSTWVPLSGHAFFDLIAYGDKMIYAWWIWM